MSTPDTSAAPGQYSSVRIEKGVRDPFVAQVTLIGPGPHNGMGPDFWAEMPRVMAELDADPEVRAAVIAGEGRNFSYGLDLMAMMPQFMDFLPQDKTPDASRNERILDFVENMRRAIDSVASAKTPTVAAVQGRCIGGAVDLISACDVRHGAADSSYSIREVKVGIVADMGSLARLPHIIGQGLTRELALTGRDIDAETALRYGLVTHVAEDAAGVLDSAHATAAEIAGNPPLVVRGTREVLNRGIEGQIYENNRYVATWNAGFLASADMMEAISATLEKREARFTGR
ncbi:MAG: crotonase/enoyl-CoA hydratase family protein [Dietzia sp.]|uniref:Crotonase/enoyl-CoA hydratase family protein n=1 Tax=Dietzia cercidiphylli TaxID=498199 RepID=A0ABN2IF85_9ACTN|nr:MULTISPECIES: crotonase/enoyl-CoA hydratase family protein [Dietzia]MBB1042733.1 crotonase/enoyl-CoA hydratase family protein [Dietzia sp. Cai40]MBB1044547.1 crotonase/enoyl-CoA hydratase family protein [Dietzia sp. DQ11-44]MBB1047061.1 crotonase/enoyl-CoA hydratase family protein [Dietzia cercidiphylli]MBC7296385.1 crotonase/enoyl-CoA hydratase family protein [Dietzia sp.]MDO8392861.1 crotonase/enoyl-CoA hydratase family protein [Dietzia sp.]